MRLLFLTDTHIRGTTPKNRKDDFPITLMNKFTELINIIKKYKVDFVLHGGDLFDRPDISVSVVSNFASLLNKIEVPIYIVSGNHDIYGHNPDTIYRTMLGLLDSLNIVNVVNRDDTIILEKDGIKTQLTAQPYIYDIDDKEKLDYYTPANIRQDVDYSIHMVHGMLLNKPFIKGIPYTLIDDIMDTKADITLSGHYHAGFGAIKVEEKYFVNPGSLVRVNNSLSEIHRKPKLAIIDLNENIDIKLLNLQAILKGEDVLDRQEIENHMFKAEKLLEFKQSIDEAINFKKIEITEILMEISNVKGISDEVKEEALRRIASSQSKNQGDDF